MSHYKKTLVPFVCCQKALGDSGLIYMLRYTNDDNPNKLSLFVNRDVIGLTLKRPLFTSEFEDEIIKIMLEHGDDLGDIVIERNIKKTFSISFTTACVINIICNRIAFETRRGGGNHLIYNKADSRQVMDIIEPIKAFGLTLNEVNTPSLQGKMIITYKGKNGELDGSPILAYNDTHYGVYTDKIKQYTKYFNLP
jgi:hypothetical protein